jgi:hypothetical protein
MITLGNRVKIIANNSCSCNKVGDIGIVTEIKRNYYRVSVENRFNCGNFSLKNDIILILNINSNIKII